MRKIKQLLRLIAIKQPSSFQQRQVVLLPLKQKKVMLLLLEL